MLFNDHNYNCRMDLGNLERTSDKNGPDFEFSGFGYRIFVNVIDFQCFYIFLYYKNVVVIVTDRYVCAIRGARIQKCTVKIDFWTRKYQ